jgi:hypothetical protein
MRLELAPPDLNMHFLIVEPQKTVGLRPTCAKKAQKGSWDT